MCRDCGCSETGQVEVAIHEHELAHAEHHGHHQGGGHHVHHDHMPRELRVERSLVEMNDRTAMHNREHFHDAGVVVVNLMSSPGAGKTRLLERTLDDLGNSLMMGVITGDLQTDNDARRLEGRGAEVVAVTTGTMCHLEADAVHRACHEIDLKSLDVLFIENVGNLVCPASFDLGEESRIVLMSVTEGEDKPLKYPPMFKLADVVLVTKSELAGPAGFDRELALQNIASVAPQAMITELSAKTGQGMNEWYTFLLEAVARRRMAEETTAASPVAAK